MIIVIFTPVSSSIIMTKDNYKDVPTAVVC